jgi:hypothetical protein
LRISKELFSAHLNNVKECNIDTPFVSKYYGFMESEVNELLTKYGVDEAMKSGIKQWYNGYTTDAGPIYNPWSIIHCLQAYEENKKAREEGRPEQAVLQSYWVESGTFDHIAPLLRLPEIREKVEELLKMSKLKFSLKRKINVADFRMLN